MVSERLKRFGMRVLDGDLVQNDVGERFIFRQTKTYDVKITAKHVLVPICGTQIAFEAPEMQKIFGECLTELVIGADEFTGALAKNRLTGADRRMLESPSDFAYEIEESSVVLRFGLKSSCYATELIRELTNSLYSGGADWEISSMNLFCFFWNRVIIKSQID